MKFGNTLEQERQLVIACDFVPTESELLTVAALKALGENNDDNEQLWNIINENMSVMFDDLRESLSKGCV